MLDDGLLGPPQGRRQRVQLRVRVGVGAMADEQDLGGDGRYPSLHLVRRHCAVAILGIVDTQGVAYEPGEEVGPAVRIEALAPLPELHQMTTVGHNIDGIDRRTIRPLRSTLGVDEGRRRQHQSTHTCRYHCRDLERNHATRVVTDEVETVDAETVNRLHDTFGEVLDRRSTGVWIGSAHARQINGDDVTSASEKRDDLGVLVPRAWRLV